MVDKVATVVEPDSGSVILSDGGPLDAPEMLTRRPFQVFHRINGDNDQATQPQRHPA